LPANRPSSQFRREEGFALSDIKNILANIKNQKIIYPLRISANLQKYKPQTLYFAGPRPLFRFFAVKVRIYYLPFYTLSINQPVYCGKNANAL
jgi:hypothetical protein